MVPSSLISSAVLILKDIQLIQTCLRNLSPPIFGFSFKRSLIFWIACSKSVELVEVRFFSWRFFILCLCQLVASLLGMNLYQRVLLVLCFRNIATARIEIFLSMERIQTLKRICYSSLCFWQLFLAIFSNAERYGTLKIVSFKPVELPGSKHRLRFIMWLDRHQQIAAMLRHKRKTGESEIWLLIKMSPWLIWSI